MAGQTGSSLVLANVSAADAGSYSVVVSGTCGNSVSSSASLTVNEDSGDFGPPRQCDQLPGHDCDLQRRRQWNWFELSMV